MAVSGERAMWSLFEPIHAVMYFAPKALQALSEAGLRGYWRGYFAGRAAPLGRVPAAAVVASFFNFAPSMVTRAFPEVWTMAEPEQVLAARVAGAVAALSDLLVDVPAGQLEEAADTLEMAVGALDPAGRVLGAVNAALPRHTDPMARLWQSATTLREHRGDGHNAALVAAGIGPCEVLVLRCGIDLVREKMQPARGWTDEAWAEAEERLHARGLVDAASRATTDGLDAFGAVEAATDLAAAAPWQELGAPAVKRLQELLAPMAKACHAVLPVENVIGLSR
jgi:hypothetical protein